MQEMNILDDIPGFVFLLLTQQTSSVNIFDFIIQNCY
jgi:hypothetical protein